MNWDAISAVAEILAAVAVLITLLYLAVQIRQAKKQLDQAGQRHRAEAARELMLVISSSGKLAPVLANLGGFPWGDNEESVRVFGWCHAWMRTEEMNYRMDPPEQRATQDQLLKGWLSVPWAAQFWLENRAIYDADFAEHMDGLLEEVRASGKDAYELFSDRDSG